MLLTVWVDALGFAALLCAPKQQQKQHGWLSAGLVSPAKSWLDGGYFDSIAGQLRLLTALTDNGHGTEPAWVYQGRRVHSQLPEL